MLANMAIEFFLLDVVITRECSHFVFTYNLFCYTVYSTWRRLLLTVNICSALLSLYAFINARKNVLCMSILKKYIPEVGARIIKSHS